MLQLATGRLITRPTYTLSGRLLLPGEIAGCDLITPSNQLDPDAKAYLDAAGITTPAFRTAWSDFVKAGKGASPNNWYSGLQYCWPFIADGPGYSFNSHKINAINPATNTLVKTGTVTSAVTGVTPDGSTGWLYTDVNAGTLDSTNCSIGLYSQATTGIDGNDFGLQDNTGAYAMTLATPRADGTTFNRLFFDGNTDAGSSVTASPGGLFVMSRSGNSMTIYRDGTLIDTVSQTGNQAQLPFGIYLFANNFFDAAQFASPSTKGVSFFYIGQKKTDPQRLSFTAAVNALQTALGRNV